MLVDVVVLLGAVILWELAHIVLLRRRLDLRERQLRDVDEYGRRDSLTGVANRAALIRALSSALEERRDVYAFLVDLDGFKEVNDSHGHPAGDMVLVTIADRLAAALGEDAIFGRLGGDEFLVLEDAPARRFVQVVGDVFATPIVTVDCRPVQVGASVGVEHVGRHRTADQVLSATDRALYAAKYREDRSADSACGRVVLAVPASNGWIRYPLGATQV
ncbi:GGDEF domain-containing protein [Myceligenerans xiligouense]|uniref:Diguanylate cyclase (GGDEF)-like protein n=1 Tax=Myceligenerans xiligouense TaxID=253184 RepID=A0A3N4YH45_9MICO|nr:GGDEF domain-containing protein [Myceligenerans xiligouense]RPF20429.1 diguanylate cyclase (GGDEF)-like protein [Myceligenerans xiligouense]